MCVAADLAQFTANFMIGVPASFVVGGPLASLVLGMDGVAGLHGWQWLFLAEGLPAFALSFIVLKMLPDGPRDASWLTVAEMNEITIRLSTKDESGRGDLWGTLRDPRVLSLGVANLFLQSSAYGVELWLPQFVQAMGFSNFATGFIVALLFFCGACAMIIGGRLSSLRDERIWHVALPLLFAASGVAVASVAAAGRPTAIECYKMGS